MDKVQWKLVSGPYGDATSSYTITIKTPMTISQFIDNELKPNEWGIIYDKNHKVAEYRHGEITETYISDNSAFWDSMLEKDVEIDADGGWSRMDYHF